jgi:hypothetical protein
MNYYVIPKNKIKPKFRLIQKSNNNLQPFISNSIFFNLNSIFGQTEKICLNDNSYNCNNDNDNIYKIINPLEFVHNTVPGTQLSVSKVKSKSNILFELMEIFQIFNILENLSNNSSINIANYSYNNESIAHLINMLRDEHSDYILNKQFNYDNLIREQLVNENENEHEYEDKKYNLLLFEYEEGYNNHIKKYILNMILTLHLILKNQQENGICIIKIDNIIHKPIIEIIYILSCLYDKVYLIKPNICNVTSGSRYLVCKQYNYNIQTTNSIKEQLEMNIINNISENFEIESIIENLIPCWFLNKLEELNAITCQQQLEYLDQTINVLRNKNKDDKIEILKRNHIQKCIQWCEKNQLPHNKFIDKTNIFLNVKKKDEKCEKVDNNDNQLLVNNITT